MTRKIIFIIIGALLFLALLALLWFWFLHRSPAADTGTNAGFGTSTDRGGSSNASGDNSNIPGNTNAGNTNGIQDDYEVTSDAGGYIVSSAGRLDSLAPGAYRISQRGRIVGPYIVGTNGTGRYTLTPQGVVGGSATLPNGRYAFTPISVNDTGISDNSVGGAIDTGAQGSTTPNTTQTITDTNREANTSTSTTTETVIDTNRGINTNTNITTETIADTNRGINTNTATTINTGGRTSGAWLGSNVSERIFTPSEIESLNNPGTLGGTPFISTTPQAAGLGTSGIVIGAAAAGCLAQYLAYEGSSAIQANTTDRAQALGAGPYVVVFDFNASAKQNNPKFKSIEECLVKTIARAAIDQITRSIVTWINSGFNGQPSFVTNFNQYFANVADQAAGEFIKSSALSFLCSPFAPQIKIAIAQSYANRNSGSGASCSLGKVTNNVNNFLKGNWGAGGWGSLLQFTTMPTNNPYGAYAYAEMSLNSSISRAQSNARNNVSPGGFISLQKCDTSKGQSAGKGNCTVTTPGSYIEESLKQSSIKGPIDGLNLAQNINDIVRALTNQVMIKAVYGGLSGSLGSIDNPLAPAIDQEASAQAQTLLASLQASANAAAQYGTVKQGSANDILQVQRNYNTLYNCWQTAASSTGLSIEQQAQAAQNANWANTQIAQLQAQIDTLNADITRTNSSIATIQDLQSQVLFAATPKDVQTAANAIQAASGSLISAADVTTAQQNRTSLQSQLTSINQQGQISQTQCRAMLGA